MSFQHAPGVKPLSTKTIACLAAMILSIAAPLDSVAVPRDDEVPTIEAKTRGMVQFVGFFDLYWAESEGKLYWEIDRWDTEFLYQVSLASGLGSNPVGLDRGQLGGTYVLKAWRVGPTVLLVEPNYGYRARSDNPYEVQAVEDAFAPSTHWGFQIEARTGDRVLVDATDFLLRDAHGVARQLEGARQGTFKLDRSRRHGDRDIADLHERATWTAGAQHGGVGGCRHASPASLARPAARRRIRAPGRRLPSRGLRGQLS
jgi:hypothetical protein